jgi:hypothetical protein
MTAISLSQQPDYFLRVPNGVIVHLQSAWQHQRLANTKRALFLDGKALAANSLPIVDTDWLSDRSAQPERVRAFCNSFGIMSSAVLAVKLAEKHFSSDSNLSLVLEDDPDSNQQWLLIEVSVKDRSTDVIQCYRNYTRELGRMVAGERRHLIRLTFYLV